MSVTRPKCACGGSFIGGKHSPDGCVSDWNGPGAPNRTVYWDSLDSLRAELAALRAEVERLTRERDEAEHRFTMTNVAHGVVEQQHMAELAAMRPVVEAACAFMNKAAPGVVVPVDVYERLDVLANAVDAYRASQPQGGSDA